MRIAINVVTMPPGRGGGEEHYLRRIAAEISALHDGIEFVFLTDEANHESFAGLNRHRVRRVADVPGAVSELGAELLFSPLDSMPGKAPCPVVLLVMNLYEARESVKRRLLGGSREKTLRETARKAAQVVVPSKFMQQEVLEKLGVPLNKIVQAPLGIDAAFAEPQRCIFEQPYLVMVGRMLPRKNIPTVLNAFQRMADELPHNLLIIGQPTDDEPTSWGPRIIRVDRLGTTQLAGALQACEVLIQPSLYEGSGIVVQEGLKAGALVACGRLGGIPEAAGNAPFYYDQTRPEALAQTVRRIVGESDTVKRRRREVGRQLTVEVTWERCARQTLSAFRKALQTG
jgi:glycosyltransferase involved in cell wall biosynthesis